MASIAKNLPVPAQLERDHILQDIFDNVDRFAKEFADVKYDTLKRDVIKPVIDNDFNPEVQIRGLMKAFQHTNTYKEAFAKIHNPDLRRQINAFVDGSSPKDVVADKGFEVAANPSPQVKHHFSLLEALKKLVLDIHELKAAIHDDLHPLNKHVQDLPVLFEDEKHTKVMEVQYSPGLRSGLTLTNRHRSTLM